MNPPSKKKLPTYNPIHGLFIPFSLLVFILEESEGAIAPLPPPDCYDPVVGTQGLRKYTRNLTQYASMYVQFLQLSFATENRAPEVFALCKVHIF